MNIVPGTVRRALDNKPSTEIVKKLGVGSFGMVFLMANGNVVKKMDIATSDRRQVFEREVRNLKIMSGHPNVMQMLTAQTEGNLGLLQISYAPGMRVDSWVDAHPDDGARRRLWRNFTETLLRTIHDCHQMGVHHLDLHPGNVMVDPERRALTVIDFGLSCNLKAGSCPDTPGMTAHYTPYFTPDDLVDPAKLRRIDLFTVGGVSYLWWFGVAPYQQGKRVEVPRWLMTTMMAAEPAPPGLQQLRSSSVTRQMLEFLLCNPSPRHTARCPDPAGATLELWRPPQVSPPSDRALWR
jgi:serine/threonine protein kinase